MNPQDKGIFVDPKNIPAGLRTSELSRHAKRWHLFGKGVRGAEAEEILDKLYGKETPNGGPNPQDQDVSSVAAS